MEVLKSGKNVNITYRLFLLFLLIDLKEKHLSVFYAIAKVALVSFRPSAHIPCTIAAAILYIKKRTGLKSLYEQKKIYSYYIEGNGFKSFEHLKSGDMLSTAASLFALKYAGSDLRIITPSCLDFIEENFDNGAFLSGDGDKTRDLEYTFYGLLALGALSEN